MSNIILWYILMVGKAYLEAGLFIALAFFMLSYVFPSDEEFTLKDFFIILFLHPIVIYYFIKSLYGDD